MSSQRTVNLSSIPLSTDCELFTPYEQWLDCGCSQPIIYTKNDVRTLCVDGIMMVAKSLVDNNTDHPVRGSSALSKTWVLISMEDFFNLVFRSNENQILIAEGLNKLLASEGYPEIKLS